MRLGERLVIGFRHFPLAEIHPFALPAAPCSVGDLLTALEKCAGHAER